jgi:hypothetical protein
MKSSPVHRPLRVTFMVLCAANGCIQKSAGLGHPRAYFSEWPPLIMPRAEEDGGQKCQKRVRLAGATNQRAKEHWWKRRATQESCRLLQCVTKTGGSMLKVHGKAEVGG